MLGSPGAFSPPPKKALPILTGGEESREYVAAQIRPCRIAIFLNIWSSIFSAAFFAYVRPAGSMDTELILDLNLSYTKAKEEKLTKWFARVDRKEQFESCGNMVTTPDRDWLVQELSWCTTLTAADWTIILKRKQNLEIVLC